MFGEIISFVEIAAFPINTELALVEAVANPIKVQVNRLGMLLVDSVICDAGSSTIVGDNRGGRLAVAKVFKADSKWAGLFNIVEEGSKFSFGGAGDNFT
jgi:hypothetical protein